MIYKVEGWDTSRMIVHGAYRRWKFHGVPINDNVSPAACIEVHSKNAGWKTHIDFDGKVYVLDAVTAGRTAWKMTQAHPALQDAAHEITESVKRIHKFNGVI